MNRSLLIAALFCVPVVADTIELKSGEKIEGKFKQATSDGATIEVGGQPLKFPLSNIRFIYLGSVPSERERPNPAEKDPAKEAAREYIRGHLKAPATAVFSKETLCAKADECKNPAFIVYRGSVDSQNGFGALIRSKYKVEVLTDETGKVLHVSDIDTQLKESCEALNEAEKALGSNRLVNCAAKYPEGQ